MFQTKTAKVLLSNPRACFKTDNKVTNYRETYIAGKTHKNGRAGSCH